jgi:hypothetical protein
MTHDHGSTLDQIWTQGEYTEALFFIPPGGTTPILATPLPWDTDMSER